MSSRRRSTKSLLAGPFANLCLASLAAVSGVRFLFSKTLVVNPVLLKTDPNFLKSEYILDPIRGIVVISCDNQFNCSAFGARLRLAFAFAPQNIYCKLRIRLMRNCLE